MLDFSAVELVDLSIGLEDGVESEPFPPAIQSYSHEEGAELLAGNLEALGIEGVSGEDFPDGKGLAWEEVRAITHTGTHLDSPWHFGPECGGEQSRTIDEVPLEWCCGNAVVLDFTWKAAGSEITPGEIDEQLAALGHDLTPGEIVLLQTGADEHWGTKEYLSQFPGMGAEATRHLIEQGITVIGTDAYGFDKPFAEMGKRYVESGDSDELWPAHFTGREHEYCHIEKMANLDALPRRTDIPLVTFPVVVENASAGWVRPVAMFEE